MGKRALSGESITHFGLGYAVQEKDALYQHCKALGYEDAILQESGLFTFKENGVRDKFFNRVIFPIMDLHHRVIGFGGRVMGEGEPKYLNSPETKLFDKSRNLFALNFARRSRESYLILCEGYMDVISMHQAGCIEAVAALGTAFTEQQAALLKRFTSTVLLCFDSDNAGRKACKRAIPILREKEIQAKVISLKPYKDPDEFLKAEGKDALMVRIHNAKNAFLWEVEELKAGFNLQDPGEMQGYMEAIASLLRDCFSDPVELENYCKAVAREQLLSAENLLYLVQKGEEKSQLSFALSKQGRREENKREKALTDNLEEQFLSLLLQKEEWIGPVSQYIKAEDLREELCRQVFLSLQSGKSVQEILDSIRGEEEKYQKCMALYHGDLYHLDLERQEEERMLLDFIRQMKLRGIEKAISEAMDGEELSRLFREKDKWEHFSGFSG